MKRIFLSLSSRNTRREKETIVNGNLQRESVRIFRTEHRIQEHRKPNLGRKKTEDGPDQDHGSVYGTTVRQEELHRVRRPQGSGATPIRISHSPD